MILELTSKNLERVRASTHMPMSFVNVIPDKTWKTINARPKLLSSSIYRGPNVHQGRPHTFVPLFLASRVVDRKA